MPQSIDPKQLAQWLSNQQPVVLLDVRMPSEHEFVAIPNSTLIPIQELPIRWKEVNLKPEETLVVYCHHGVRSWHAAMFLESVGLERVYSLDGGIDAWAMEVDQGMERYQ